MSAITYSLDHVHINANAVLRVECKHSGPEFPPLPLSGADTVHDEADKPTTATGTRIIDHHLDESGSKSNNNLSISTAGCGNVKFDKVTIRSYNRTVVDHPSCTSGVPVGLSWEYDTQEIEMSVEAYESSRDGNRRSKGQMLMPRDVRIDLLRNEFDVSMKEISQVGDEVERAQQHRMRALSLPRRKRREMVDRIIKTTNCWGCRKK